ncbi:hypothetical protein HHL28_04395 [Aerophototrophica crusticola]|uniref:Uncharacterized protein n=1 Tax=Aerophototrophica crusticola TaxID=1709002 RepID=A0A858R4X9_9PROT|nr:hypothetical protein HHL28_04395 [Rhodospirillaceae bacterium B3]
MGRLRPPRNEGILLSLSREEQDTLRAILAESAAEEPPPPPARPPLWPKLLAAGLSLAIPLALVLSLPEARDAILGAVMRALAVLANP